MRRLILAPLVIVMAFTLPSRGMMITQIIAGVALGAVGITDIVLEIVWARRERRKVGLEPKP